MSQDALNSWEIAMRYSGLVGAIPSSFTTTVRTLLAAHREDPKHLSKSATHVISRLLQSPTLTAAFYYYSMTFPGVRRMEEGHVSKSDLLRRFSGPLHLADTLVMTYLYKRVKRICPEDSFRLIARETHIACELGTRIGFSMPQLGPGCGAIAESVHTLARALYSIHDKKGYINYLTHLKKTGQSHDFEFQEQQWGCNQVQVASSLLRLFGYGIDLSTSFAEGAERMTPPDADDQIDSYLFHISSRWIRAIRATGEPPNLVHSGRYYPKDEDLEQLRTLVSELEGCDPSSYFFEKSKDDINPELTPQLFKEQSKPETEIIEDEEIELVAKELPPEILEHYTPEECEQLKYFSEAEIMEILQEVLAIKEAEEAK